MTAAVRGAAPPVAATAAAPTQIAKAAFRRLAIERLEPTPENYAQAYRAEAGDAAPPALSAEATGVLDRLVATLVPHLPQTIGLHSRDKLAELLLRSVRNARWDHAARVLDTLLNADAAGTEAASLARLFERLLAGIERGTRQWTVARRKEGVQRVLDASRGDPRRLQQRLTGLVASWEAPAGEGGADPDPDLAVEAGAAPPHPQAPPADEAAAAAVPPPDDAAAWSSAFATVAGSLAGALADDRAAAEAGAAVAPELGRIAASIVADGPQAAHLVHLDALCARTGYAVQHRNHLLDQLSALCRELTSGLGELAEDDSWAKGQLEAARLRLEDGLTARSVRSVIELLGHTRKQQHAIRAERSQARDALKTLIARMLGDLGELGSQTDTFNDHVGRYADRVERADTLESLTGVVSEMVEETRGVQRLVGQTQQRLQSAHQHASTLSGRVSELENDLRRLSDEVATDPLTQIANRRGLMQAFDVERARCERDGGDLAIGLLDIDNFKRLNDDLGHGIGDRALVSLAGAVASALRPGDTVARYGGEEFVVLLPLTRLDDAQQLLTRMQRSLTGSLFMHENRQVFVTFSAGVSVYRLGERVEAAIERADQALYEAKRTGKNRTCVCP